MTTHRPGGPAPPFQFTLRQLLGAMVFVCVGCALIYWFGFAFGTLLTLAGASLEFAAYFAWKQQFAKAAATIFFSALLGFLILPLYSLSQMSVRPASCPRNLHNVAIALQIYHDEYNSFPPACIADVNGKPIHSWRVLILPYIEQQQLYDLYSFDEPWDGPNNSRLHHITLKLFCCPSDTNYGPTTSYLAVTGPQTIWPGTTTTKMSDIKDGSANTILLVEAHNSGIHWLEPRDLDITTMPMTVNSPKGLSISSGHNHRGPFANVVCADGHIQSLPATTSSKSLRAAFTISGGEKDKLPIVRLPR